jgi:hypothetical protein
MSYGVKIYAYYKSVRLQQITDKIESYLRHCVEQGGGYNPEFMMAYQRYLTVLVDIITRLDISMKEKRWAEIRRDLIENMALPYASTLVNSRFWRQRFKLCMLLQLSHENRHELLVKILIEDPIPLVSINAAMVAVQYKSQLLIDAVIDLLSKGRRVQQSLYSQVISSADADVIPLIQHRLLREKDPYIKAFCYRTLMSIPYRVDTVKCVDSDLESNILDLKISALNYLHHNDKEKAVPLLTRLLKDPRWEVRAQAAKLLGGLGDDTVINSLGTCLRDKVWWVRINAAEALCHFGKKGISLLKNQDPMADKYAYDVAMQVLLTIK